MRFLKSIKLNALFFSIPHLIIHVRIHRSLQSFRIKLIAIITGEGVFICIEIERKENGESKSMAAERVCRVGCYTCRPVSKAV